jgi:uncharacterized membrane protein YphA (DoxX/SURF4 family)
VNRLSVASICAFILGAVFLLAAFSKIGDLVAFHDAVEKLAFLSIWAKAFSILIIPGLEVALGICFLCHFQIRETAIIASALLLIFLSVEFYANTIGQTVGCGCFHIKAPIWMQLSGWWTVVRDSILLCLSLIVCFARHSASSR